MGSGEGLRGEGGEEGRWGRVLTPKSKENKPPSHWPTRNQSWRGFVRSGVLGEAGMGSRRLNLGLNPFANMHGSGERRASQAAGLQCKLSPRPPRPPPPLRAGVISKGVGCARADPPAAAQAEHGLAPPPALQTPAAPPASCFCLARAQDSRNTHRKTTASEEEELEEKEERGGGRGGGGAGESRGRALEPRPLPRLALRENTGHAPFP